MMALINDPYVGESRVLDSCRTLDAVGDYLPVESLAPGRWFAVYLPTMTTVLLENLDGGCIEIASAVSQAITSDKIFEDALFLGDSAHAALPYTSIAEAFVDRQSTLLEAFIGESV